MFKNTASQKITLFAFIPSTGLPKTGDAANLTAYVSKDDGTVTALTDTSATETDATNGKGLYIFDVSQTETNADKLVFSCKSSTSDVSIVPVTIYTRPPNAGALSIDSNGRVDVIKVAGTTQTARDLGTSVLVAGDFSATMKTSLETGVVNGLTTFDPPTVAEMVDGVFAHAYEGSETFESFCRLIRSAIVGIVSGAGTTTVTFRNAADSGNRIVATVDSSGNRSALTLTTS